MSRKRTTRRRGPQWRTLVLVACTLNLALFSGVSSTENVPYTATTTSLSVRALIKAPLLAAATAPVDPLVFTAPPQESAERARELYRPIAHYLSTVTGKQVVYRYPGNWRAYQRGMQKGDYDLVFDSPHFASWRIAKLEHEPLIRIAGQHTFVVVVRNGNDEIIQLEDLAGRSVCGPLAPSQGTLSLYSQFDNPARRPVLVRVDGWRNTYQAMIDGACDSAIIPLHVHEDVDPHSKNARVLFKSVAMPDHTLTAGPRLSAHEKAIITRALLAAEGRKVTKALCERFRAEKMIPASKPEYAGLHALLRNTWGFDT